VLPTGAEAVEYGGAVFEASELAAERWDYVALGHYHVAHAVRPNAWYSGALEYVSPNPWGELRDEEREGRPGIKGWLAVELGKEPRVTLRAVPLARRLLDLKPIQAAGMAAAAVNRLIAERIGGVAGGIEDQLVRLVVHDIPTPVARELDHAAIRGFKAQALHFQLDLRRPGSRRLVGVGAPGPRHTLDDVVAEYLARRPLDADLDRGRLVALGRRYLDEAERATRDD
jgi:exonuclease SbcD